LAENTIKEITFQEILFNNFNSSLNLKFNKFDIEPFAKVNYEDELKLKNQSLAGFWKNFNLDKAPENIEPSVKPRFYRTTSKRKIVFKSDKFYLVHSENSMLSKKLVEQSLLEPEEHFKVFEFLSALINKPTNKFLSRHLNYIIIRGNYLEFSVIFNTNLLNADIVRKLKAISSELEKSDKKIISAFLYFDPSESDFYFESKVPKDELQFKKLFGKPKITVSYEGNKYFFHPISFSQINESLTGTMLKKAAELLNPSSDMRLIDLYCGYGLFSYYFADKVSEVLGIDFKGEAINSAVESLDFYKGKSKIKFRAFDINYSTLDKNLPIERKEEIIILDPPRQGTKANVISLLAGRNPRFVLHIFCGVDGIPDEIANWKQNGYGIKRIVPLDMFPGTPNLEILVLLERSS